ncbi:hypothetical protein DERP_001740 [Dermatophagoides pteronyssinus]|uniref:Uncharacterized protein n=1 Tax=Dermatophagoides pteronyssinus TaxID=6956 RepID=A0ABQ8JBX4_DERPT|nr:hypothetical protein DERP_001740 [Dermatophagoides pteronyssinus]
MYRNDRKCYLLSQRLFFSSSSYIVDKLKHLHNPSSFIEYKKDNHQISDSPLLLTCDNVNTDISLTSSSPP